MCVAFDFPHPSLYYLVNKPTTTTHTYTHRTTMGITSSSTTVEQDNRIHTFARPYTVSPANTILTDCLPSKVLIVGQSPCDCKDVDAGVCQDKPLCGAIGAVGIADNVREGMRDIIAVRGECDNVDADDDAKLMTSRRKIWVGSEKADGQTRRTAIHLANIIDGAELRENASAAERNEPFDIVVVAEDAHALAHKWGSIVRAKVEFGTCTDMFVLSRDASVGCVF